MKSELPLEMISFLMSYTLETPKVLELWVLYSNIILKVFRSLGCVYTYYTLSAPFFPACVKSSNVGTCA